jgi:hypothetical protein
MDHERGAVTGAPLAGVTLFREVDRRRCERQMIDEARLRQRCPDASRMRDGRR